MNVKLQLNILTTIKFFELMHLSGQSITGVTYRDHFDFEERFSNKHECDPFYWYPLHLPERCAVDLEKRVRNQIKHLREKEEDRLIEYMIHYLNKNDKNQYESSRDVSGSNEDVMSYQYSPYTFGKVGSYESSEMIYQVPEWPKYTYEQWSRPKQPLKMLDLLSKDIRKQPTLPFIGFFPFIGLSAIYRQRVSKNTVDVIKDTANAYADAAEETGLIWKPGELYESTTQQPTIDSENGMPKVDDDIKKEFNDIKAFIEEIKKEQNEQQDKTNNNEMKNKLFVNGVIKRKVKKFVV